MSVVEGKKFKFNFMFVELMFFRFGLLFDHTHARVCLVKFTLDCTGTPARRLSPAFSFAQGKRDQVTHAPARVRVVKVYSIDWVRLRLDIFYAVMDVNVDQTRAAG